MHIACGNESLPLKLVREEMMNIIIEKAYKKGILLKHGSVTFGYGGFEFSGWLKGVEPIIL